MGQTNPKAGEIQEFTQQKQNTGNTEENRQETLKRRDTMSHDKLAKTKGKTQEGVGG